MINFSSAVNPTFSALSSTFAAWMSNTYPAADFMSVVFFMVLKVISWIGLIISIGFLIKMRLGRNSV